MIVPVEELERYIGNDLCRLNGKVRPETLRILEEYQNGIDGISVIDYLFLEHQRGRSFRDLEREVMGISHVLIAKILKIYGLPILTREEAIHRKWREDEEFRLRHKKAAESMWRDPEYREKMLSANRRLWEDQDYRQRHGASVRRLWEDEEFRRRNMDGVKRNWQNPEFREKMNTIIKNRWKDPDFRRKILESSRKSRRDNPDYEKRRIEATRRARLDPNNIGKYALPTISGYRRDIDFIAQSTWEANFARVLMYCNRDFYTKEIFRLNVPDCYRHLFRSGETEMWIDFVTSDNRGSIVLYDIVAHPLEEPAGIAKMDMLRHQYPDLNVRIIDEETYERFRDYFEGKINDDMRFRGWETYQDNLRTSPQKYS